jgi:hypothetical protein
LIAGSTEASTAKAAQRVGVVVFKGSVVVWVLVPALLLAPVFDAPLSPSRPAFGGAAETLVAFGVELLLPRLVPRVEGMIVALTAVSAARLAVLDVLPGQVKHWPEQPLGPQPKPQVCSPLAPHFFSQ